MSLPKCPQCQEDHTYPDGHLYICPICFHEWTEESLKEAEEALLTRDANGNVLNNGDDVFIVTDLKLGKDTLKQGTKVKNIRILDEAINDHDLQAKVDGFGTLYLKSSVVKK